MGLLELREGAWEGMDMIVNRTIHDLVPVNWSYS